MVVETGGSLSVGAESGSTVSPSNSFVEFLRSDIEQSIGARFQQIVARDPGHIAIKVEDRQVTYDVLNRMANRVAHALQSTYGSNNDPIAVFGGNDAETIAAILGVLKAGKVYVPLDKSYSETWVKFILQDTAAKVIINTQADIGPVSLGLSASHVLIDYDSLGSGWSEEDPEAEVSPDALSQILYTSGTTGHPKGVMDNHRNMLHNARRLINAFHLSPNDRMTLVRPPSSGGGLCNILLPSLCGATVYPVDLKQIGFAAIADWLLREQITIFYVGAVLFRHFCQQLAGTEQFPSLRLVRVGSGQMYDDDVELYKRHFPGALLVHNLSCTEANTYRVHFLDRNSVIPRGILPVGFAVEDVEVTIVDENGKPLAPGAIGEIAIRSSYLFVGYWNNPTLTASVFMGDRDTDGGRVYLTGDMGRLQPTGCLEFLGRKDFRFKVRGHSIQAEEVELALLRLPEVGQAVVLGQKDNYGDDRLVAYIVPTTETNPTVTYLRNSLQDLLAAHMIPSKFIILDSLPQSSNGRVKRQELPNPGYDRPKLASPFSAPNNPLETLLAHIWSEVLKTYPVGTHDNFFDLGGDSIVAMNVIAALGRVFPWDLTLAEFYQAGTVALMAELLTRKTPNEKQAKRIAELYLQVASMSANEVETTLANLRHEPRSRKTKVGS